MKPQEKKKEKEIKKQKKEKKKEKKKNKTKTNDQESQGSKQSISDSPKSSKPVTSEWTTASKPQLQDILKQKLREGISTEEYNQIIKLLQKSNPSTPIGTSNLSSPFSGQVPIMFYPQYPGQFQRPRRRKSSTRRNVGINVYMLD